LLLQTGREPAATAQLQCGGPPQRRTIDRLNAHCCRFVSLSPFLVLASANGARACA